MSVLDPLPGSSTVVDPDIDGIWFQTRQKPLAYFRHQFSDSRLFICREFVDARDMLAGRNQRMAVCNRVGVHESNRVLVLDPFAAGVKRAEGAGRHPLLHIL